jgi:hypothetical protein
MCNVTKNSLFPLLISTQSVAFWYTDFYTTLYFVNQRHYKTPATQAHALTRTRYFYSLNVARKVWVISPYVLSFRGICNSHPSSELFCVHCTHTNIVNYARFSYCCGMYCLLSFRPNYYSSPFLPDVFIFYLYGNCSDMTKWWVISLLLGLYLTQILSAYATWQQVKPPHAFLRQTDKL